MSLPTQNTTSINKDRIYYFDFLRLALVLLALVSHYIGSQGWEKYLDRDSFLILKIFSRTAMPCLLIIFGFMFEYVYASRWKSKGPETILKRMIGRTILCYLAFISLAFIGLLTHKNSPSIFLKSLVLLESARHASLFKYYAMLIPMIFTIMWLRFKFSLAYSVLFILLLIILAEVLNVLITETHDSLDHIAGMTFGIGDNWGPSVAHALILTTFGMVSANYVLRKGWSAQNILALIMIAFSIVLISLELMSIGFSQFIDNVVDISKYRAHNNYLYFAYGITAFVLFTGIAYLIDKLFGPRIMKWFTLYGGNTFTIFFWGNAIILMEPSITKRFGFNASVFGLFATLIAAMIAVNVVEFINNKFKVLDKFNKSVDYIYGNITRKNKISQLSS